MPLDFCKPIYEGALWRPLLSLQFLASSLHCSSLHEHEARIRSRARFQHPYTSKKGPPTFGNSCILCLHAMRQTQALPANKGLPTHVNPDEVLRGLLFGAQKKVGQKYGSYYTGVYIGVPPYNSNQHNSRPKLKRLLLLTRKVLHDLSTL